MLVLETIAKIRRAYFAQNKPIKTLCRDFRVSRMVVRQEMACRARHRDGGGLCAAELCARRGLPVRPVARDRADQRGAAHSKVKPFGFYPYSRDRKGPLLQRLP